MFNWGLQDADEGDERRYSTDSGSNASVASGSDGEGEHADAAGVPMEIAEGAALAGRQVEERSGGSVPAETLEPLERTQVNVQLAS